jgi:hypothetical protein
MNIFCDEIYGRFMEVQTPHKIILTEALFGSNISKYVLPNSKHKQT